MIKRSIISLAAVGLLCAGAIGLGPADAGDKPLGVVELFTSQGCSSCPPADAMLGDLVVQGDVIALAYHVDYWDYLGWRDTLASPDNTERQYGYGKALGVRSVYTPQAVVNGRIHTNGSDRKAVREALDNLARTGRGMSVELSVTRAGDSYVIEAGEATDGIRNAHLVLVYFDARRQVAIERGENSGRTIDYWNAVTSVQAAGMWHGAPVRFELPASEIGKKDGCAVLLQAVDGAGLPGPILAAKVIRRGRSPKE